MNKKNITNKGFSFVEVVISLSLFIVLGGIGIGAYFQYYTFSLIKTDVNNALTLVKEMRFLSLKNPGNFDYGIHINQTAGTITGFKDTYVPENDENRVVLLEQISITDLNLEPEISITDEIIFQVQTGKTVNTGSFTMEKGDFSYTININSQGVIN